MDGVWNFLRRILPKSITRPLARRLFQWLANWYEFSFRLPDPVTGETVYVAGFFSSSHGVGRSAHFIASGLEEAGHTVERLDIGVIEARDLLVGPAEEKLGGTLIVCANPPEFIYALRKLGIHRNSDTKIIGYWAWELPEMPASWLRRTKMCHEVWVPSRFVQSSMEHAAAKARIIPPYIHHPRVTGEVDRERPDGAFTAAVIFDMNSSFSRKNPLASIRAFCQAFDETDNAELIIKMQNGHTRPELMRVLREETLGRRDIRIVDEIWSAGQMQNLISGADVVLSLHRSEGFGLVVAEGLSYARPVIATAWSGSQDMVSEETAYPVGYEMIEVRDSQNRYKGQLWADPSIEEAAQALRSIFTDREAARQRGLAGQAFMERKFGLDEFKRRTVAADL